jgi:hypothetical protein
MGGRKAGSGIESKFIPSEKSPALMKILQSRYPMTDEMSLPMRKLEAKSKLLEALKGDLNTL